MSPLYGTMRCTSLCRVSLACQLSANTLRILKRTFGRVELVNPPAVQKTTTVGGTFQTLDSDYDSRKISKADQDWNLTERTLSKVDGDGYDSTSQFIE